MFNLSSKLNRNVLVSSDQGIMIVNRFDRNENNVGQSQFILDHSNASTVEVQETYDVLKNIENPVIFDIGANIGTYTTWLAKIFPQGKIYCFEPQRLIFQMLCGTLALNNHDNCFVYNIGLGKENKFIELNEPNYNDYNSFGDFSLIEKKFDSVSSYTTTTEIKTLDTFVQQFNIKHIDFIKIDAEGMDIDILIGGMETIEKYNPCILIEHCDSRKSVYSDIIRIFENMDYNFKLVGNNLLVKPNF